MRLYLNAGNGGYPMGGHAIGIIKDHLFDGVRLAMANGIPRERVRSVVTELAEADLEAVLIIGGWDWWDDTFNMEVSDRERVPPMDLVTLDAITVAQEAQKVGLRFWIEPGNEPNLAPEKFKGDPDGFASRVRVVAMVLAQDEFLKPVRLISGGVSNVWPHDGLAYARRMAAGRLPAHVTLGIHPYRMNRMPHEDLGERSIGSIANEIRDLHPRYAITEGGWHTAPRRRKRGFPLCFTYETIPGWTDDEVATFAPWELNFWAAAGAELYVWYQLNSGPDENEAEHNFGIREMDGTLRPVADALREWRAKQGGTI